VDLPVPRSPKISTPPMVGSIAASSRARFISSWATMAENGNGGARPSAGKAAARFGARRGRLAIAAAGIAREAPVSPDSASPSRRRRCPTTSA